MNFDLFEDLDDNPASTVAEPVSGHGLWKAEDCDHFIDMDQLAELTEEWPAPAVGALFRILSFQARHGYIPAEKIRLRRICREVNPDVFDAVWMRVQDLLSDDGEEGLRCSEQLLRNTKRLGRVIQ